MIGFRNVSLWISNTLNIKRIGMAFCHIFWIYVLYIPMIYMYISRAFSMSEDSWFPHLSCLETHFLCLIHSHGIWQVSVVPNEWAKLFKVVKLGLYYIHQDWANRPWLENSKYTVLLVKYVKLLLSWDYFVHLMKWRSRTVFFLLI